MQREDEKKAQKILEKDLKQLSTFWIDLKSDEFSSLKNIWQVRSRI
jgi:uncharacterized protein with gpF-like domain